MGWIRGGLKFVRGGPQPNPPLTNAEIVNLIADIRPGVAVDNPSIQRRHRLENERIEANAKNRQQSKKELELKNRQQALSKPLGADTKGWKLGGISQILIC